MRAVEMAGETERLLSASVILLWIDQRYSSPRIVERIQGSLVEDLTGFYPDESQQRVGLLYVNHKTFGEVLVRRMTGQVGTRISGSLMLLLLRYYCSVRLRRPQDKVAKPLECVFELRMSVNP